MTTVEEIARHIVPPEVVQRVGPAARGREVARAVTLKPNPPGLPELDGSELVLVSTTTLQLLDPDLTVGRLVAAISGRAAAIAVAGEIDADAQAAAAKAGIALLVLPPDADLRSLETEVRQIILARKTELFALRRRAVRALSEAAGQGDGIRAVAACMSELAQCAVVIRGAVTVVASSTPSRALYERLQRFARGELVVPELADQNVRPETGLYRLSTRAGDAQTRVEISMIGTAAGLTTRARVVLESAAPALSSVLSDRSHGGVETSRHSHLISALIAGTGHPADISKRMRAEEISLDLAWMALAVRPERLSQSMEMAAPALAAAVTGLVLELERAGWRCLVYSTADETVIFICRPDSRSHTLEASPREPPTLPAPEAGLIVGASLPHSGAGAFQQCFREASESAQVARQLGLRGRIIRFSELGVYRLLSGLRGSTNLLQFQEEILGKLVEYDDRHRGNLLATLDTWLDGPNTVEVARRLNLHRNTLSYRLRRISSIASVDLDDPDTRFTFQLALRARHVLGGPSRI